MGKKTRMFLAMAMVVTACAPATGTTTTIKDPPKTTTTLKNGVSTSSSSTSTSTTKPDTTTSTLNNRAADAANAAEGQEASVEATHKDGGLLASNGQFKESDATTNPMPEIKIHFYTDENGQVMVYVEGPPGLLRELSIEFDALDSGGSLVSETSYVGDQSKPPNWVPTTPKGTLRDANDEPPPADTNSADRLGVHIPTGISTFQEFAFISTWLYRTLDSGDIDYSHFEVGFQELIDNADLSVLAAAAFFRLIPPEVFFERLGWVLLFGT